jgi:hypothetical protein
MAYNFEATFVQPLLNDLDNGLIAGADDWANAITKYYLNTIKQGMPQGVPVTLPAPGLNPTAPPPFPIGASPFLTANSRRRLFYDTVHAYFLAKDISLNESAVRSLASTIKQLSAKIKTRRAQIKTLTQEIKAVTKELSQVPQIIKDITEGVKLAIKIEIETVDELFSSLDGFKVNYTEQDFQQTFSNELAVINLIKNFDISDVQGLLQLRNYAKQYKQRYAGPDAKLQIKRYIIERLIEIISRIVSYSDLLLNPSQFVDFVNNLAKLDARLKRFAAAVRRLDFVERYIRPKLKKLEIQKKAKIKEIEEALQSKVDAVKQRLEDKISELKSRKSESKKKGLYESAARRVKDLKERNKEKITKAKSTIKKVKSISKKSAAITKKILTLKLGLEQEFESLKQTLAGLKGSVQDNEKDLQGLQEYMKQGGLLEYTNAAVMVLVETGCTLRDFINEFDLKRKTYQQYALEIRLLREDLDSLIEEIQSLNENSVRKQIRRQYDPESNSKGKSLKQLLHEFLVYLVPASEKLIIFIDKEKKKLEKFIEKTSAKFEDDLELFLINIVPLKSDVQDSKDKQAELEAKKKRIEETKKQVKKIKEYSGNVLLVSKNAPKLIQNISSGKFKPSENDTYVKGIADGIYGFRSVDQPDNVKKQIKIEKENFIGEFKMLVVMEQLVSSIVLVFQQLNRGGAAKDFDQFVSELERDSKTSGSQLTSFLKTLSDLSKNPPKTPSEVKNLVESISLDVLEDIAVVNKLLAVEAKHLRQARQGFKTLADVKKLDKYPKAQSVVQKWNKTINKQDSFLKFLFKELRRLVKEFVQFIQKKVKQFLEPAKLFIQKKTARFKEDLDKKLQTIKDKNVNSEAPLMSITFGLAARIFWTGAQWVGPTGSTHTTLSIGPFQRIKAKPNEGASEMIRQMAASFERQLQVMNGIVLPPANTGIPPIPFNGYI